MGKTATIKQRLRAAIEEKGYPVRSLLGAQGWYRINKRFDDTITCWDAVIELPSGIKTIVHSYDTMTACVRNGFTLHLDSEPHFAWAKERDAA